MTLPYDTAAPTIDPPAPPGDTTVAEAAAGVSRRRRRLRRWAFGLVAAALAALSLTVPEVRHQVALSFTHQPDTFTELWLESEPTVATDDRGGATASLRFTIANHEARTMDYPWTVTVDHGAVTARAATGTSAVDDDGRITVPVTVRLNPGRGPQRVSVQLDGRPERIHVEVRP
jgi:hypothetical protein